MNYCCGYLHLVYIYLFGFNMFPTKCFLFVGAKKIKFVTVVSDGFSGRRGIKFCYLER